eukprot:6171643-Ditylum_brightwellii.AAC.1
MRWHINTTFGAICAVIIIVAIISCKQYPTKDAAENANTAPQTSQNNPIPPNNKKHNNQLSCAFTSTSRTPSSHQHCHHGNSVLLSADAAIFLAPKPGNGTYNTGVCSVCKIAADNIASPHH